MEPGGSMSIPVPNIISSNPSGGRFDFDDGGTYWGGWQDGKAHGHGVCTGPKNVGEYSGSWNFGFEMSGVYKWQNGAVYEGRWQNGKRHGVGVEYNGKWIYKGEWSQGYKGRYGVKASSNSAVKYEGTWASGLQDGYGTETYSDGGYYQGQMFRGLRHGYGVRKSAPYGDSQLNNPHKNGSTLAGNIMIHSNSLHSGASIDLDDETPKPEDGFKPTIERTLASKNGFVLVAKPLDVPMSVTGGRHALNGGGASGADHHNYHNHSLSSPSHKMLSSSSRAGDNASISPSSRRNSLTNRLASRIPGSSHSTAANLFRGILRRQKSTSDLDAMSGPGGRLTPGDGGSGGGRRNVHSSTSGHHGPDDDGLPIVPFSLSPEELDITDPTTVETYTGEWKNDKRNGYGICERSDGLKYEGQWQNDMKSGYGVTTFKDGTKEEGKYKNNILIVDSKVKRFFHLGGSNIRQRIDDAVKIAQQAQTMALKKAEIADTRAATARDKADQATTAALEASRDSAIAYSVARQYSGGPPAAEMQYNQFGQFALQQIALLDQQPLMPNFGVNSNALQQRRMSQHQHQQQQQQMQFATANQFAPNQRPFNQQQVQQQSMSMNDQSMDSRQPPASLQRQHSMQSQQQQQQQQQHNQQQQQSQQQQQTQRYLGLNVEPFNGRRGSFRGNSSSQPSSGYHSGLASSTRAPRFQQSSSQQDAASMSGAGNRQANPFNDLFDHYTPTGRGSPSHASGASSSRRAGLQKQTSLDYSQLRGSSGGGGGGYSRGSYAPSDHNEAGHRREAMRRSRHTSMDHPEDHYVRTSPPDSMNPQPQQRVNDMQQRLQHLVTSGEEMSGNREPASSQQQQQNGEMRGPTPTGGSSYISPLSTGSSYYGGQQTPSPEGNSSMRAPSSQYNDANVSTLRGQGNAVAAAAAGPNRYAPMMSGGGGQYARINGGQRDVHSLADEQLYLADGRRGGDAYPGDRGEFTNYDFTISRAMRPSQRLMRRTHSLSRGTPVRAAALRSLSQQRPISPAAAAASMAPQAHTGSNSRLASGFAAHNLAQPGFELSSSVANNYNARANAALLTDAAGEPLSASRLTLDSQASSGVLARKPSLQVRYDPIALGGLMSREEVAALSHAQREQKRLEAEMAEKRAKHPLLHLYLSFKEFVSQQRLLLSVLLINMCLFKLFADLIV